MNPPYTALAAIATLVALAVAMLTLIVGVADELVDARRPLATLAATGVEEDALARVLKHQLAAVARPALLLGVLLVTSGVLALIHTPSGGWAEATAMALLLAWTVVEVGTRLAVRVLRPRLRAAIEPDNLRVG